MSDKNLSDELLSTSTDDIWGERTNSMHDKKIMGDKSFMFYPQDIEPKHSYLPLLILVAVILAAIVGLLHVASGLFK